MADRVTVASVEAVLAGEEVEASEEEVHREDGSMPKITIWSNKHLFRYH